MKLTTITLASALVLSSTSAFAYTIHPKHTSGVRTYQGGAYNAYATYGGPSYGQYPGPSYRGYRLERHRRRTDRFGRWRYLRELRA
jgi:hypothetical protein